LRKKKGVKVIFIYYAVPLLKSFKIITNWFKRQLNSSFSMLYDFGISTKYYKDRWL